MEGSLSMGEESMVFPKNGRNDIINVSLEAPNEFH